MGLRLRYAAYTLPWLGDFKQKVASIPVLPGTGTGQVGLFTTAGNASVTANLAKFNRIDKVIADNEGSLMRVFDGPDIIDEWIIKRGSREISSDAKTFPLSGPALASIFDQYLVPAFDAPTNPVEQGSWEWGAENILGNPGFEDNQTTNQTYSIQITATGGTFTFSDGTDTTSAITVTGTPSTDQAAIHDALQDDISAITDVAVMASGTSPNTYDILLADPAFGVALTIAVGSLTGGTATLTQTEEGGLTPSPWHRAQQIVFGINQEAGGYDAFEVSGDHNSTPGGSYSLKVDPGVLGSTSNRQGGAQQVVSVSPGLFQAAINVYPTSGTDLYRLGIFTASGEWIANSGHAGQTLTADTFSQISIADVVVPDGVTQVIFRLQNTNTYPSNPAPFYIDDAELYPGLPASDPGDILTLLFDAHPEIGNWIDYSSISGTDSNGDAYPEDISFEVQWGEHYGHVLDRLVDLGYEWELVPKATPVGTLTHDFHLYVGGGRDATYQNAGVPTTAINKGQSITGGEVVKRIPDYTSVLLEGAGGAWSQVTDAATETQFGVLEKFVANRQLLNDTTRVLAADQFLAYEEANRRATRIEVTASLVHPRPLRAYRPGDSIPWQIPPALPKESRRVQRVDYTNTFPTRYVVTGSRVLDGEAAAYDLIWRLWRRFNRPPVVEAGPVAVEGGKGGAFTIQIAAHNASEESKAKADLHCTGVADNNVIQDAINRLTNLAPGSLSGGRILLSEGQFNLGINIWAFEFPAGNWGFTIEGTQQVGGMATTLNVTSVTGSNPRVFQWSSNRLRVKNIQFDGNNLGTGLRALSTTNGEFIVENCSFSRFAVALSGGGGYSHILNSFFQANAVDVSGSFANGCLIMGNEFIQATSSVAAVQVSGQSNGNLTVFAFNKIRDPVGRGLQTFGNVLVTGNMIFGGTTGVLVQVSGAGTYPHIINNHIEAPLATGITVESANGLISGNVINDPDTHGILVTGSNNEIVDNQIIDPSDISANTSDGIIVDGDADDNYIHGNKVRILTSGQARYGINIDDTTGDNNIYVGNRVLGTPGTAAYRDNGTGTINTWPAAAAPQGDNF